MRAIWKYPIDVIDRQHVVMQVGARVLAVQVQRGQICLWADVDTNAPTEVSSVLVVGTGNPVPDDLDAHEYAGTVQHGPLVWHVYVTPRTPETAQ